MSHKGSVYATKTKERARKREEGQEHPHVRGEVQSFLPSARMPFGTSPHTWGRRRMELEEIVLSNRNIPTSVGKTIIVRIAKEGNIPTSVGKTTTCMTTTARLEHPHVRGEDTKNVKQNQRLNI